MNKIISEILERFYICTNLPILAYDGQGFLIDSSGYDDSLYELLKDNDIYNKAMNKYDLLIDKNPIIITCPNGINYTICLLDTSGLNKGIYILGPHSCNKNNPLGISYKPKCLMNNLVSLLYIISREINHGRNFKAGFSYHVKKTLDFIESRYNENITLLDLAKHLNINKSYLCSLI